MDLSTAFETEGKERIKNVFFFSEKLLDTAHQHRNNSFTKLTRATKDLIFSTLFPPDLNWLRVVMVTCTVVEKSAGPSDDRTNA